MTGKFEMPKFEDVIGLDDLRPSEISRLRRVHEMLLAAGAPEELPTGLIEPIRPPAPLRLVEPLAAETPALDAPDEREHSVVVPLHARRRRPGAALLVAATVSVACFGGGYVLAQQAHQGQKSAVSVVTMQGSQNEFASATVEFGSPIGDGFSPIALRVTGLTAKKRYSLVVWQNGRASTVLGTFVVGKDGVANARFNIPSRFRV